MSWRSAVVALLSAVQVAALALILEIPAPLPFGAHLAAAAEPARQSGDLFVGSPSLIDGSTSAGGIWRVRGTTATLFCASPTSTFDPGFWNVPDSVIVDSRGRIAFLATLGNGNIGLLRCDAPGAPAEQLAGLRVRGPLPTGWPAPFPDLLFGVRVGSLHILAERVITDDLRSAPKVNNEDSYEFVAQLQSPAGDPSLPGPWELFRLGADTGRWQHGQDLPALPVQGGNLKSVVAHGDSLWMLDGGLLRRTTLPFQVGIAGTIGGTEVRASLAIFGAIHEIGPAIVDDTAVSNLDSGCGDPTRHVPPHSAPPSLAMPLVDGGFSALSGSALAYDEQGSLGLVIRSSGGQPYLTHASSALLNDDPQDDLEGFFHNPFNDCAHVPWLQYSQLLPATSPGSTVAFDNTADVIATAPGGLVGTQFWGNRVLRLTAGDRATEIVTLLHPQGIAAYPAVVPSLGTIVYVTVHSPVDVLLTDAAGRRLGVDPATGAPVNDFQARGFDSGPGEPRVFAIQDPAPGAFRLSSIGTGSGPYTIHVASADLATGVSAAITTSGTAVPGVAGSHDFTLSAAGGGLAFAQPVVTTPPTVTPHVAGTSGANGWYVSDVAVTWDVADGGSPITATSGCGPTAVVVDTAGVVLRCSATNAGGTTTSTVTIGRDTVAPRVAFGPAQPPPNAAGWNNADVLVPFTATDDGGSGLDGTAPASPLAFIGETPGEARSVTAVDLAGNRTTVVSPPIRIDRTPPVTSATPDHAPNATGWNNLPVAVSLACADGLAGCATTTYELDGASWTPYLAAIPVTTEGLHTLRYRSTDRADNSEAIRTLLVRLDFTPPDAVIRFDPATLDLVVLPHDPGDTAELISAVPAPRRTDPTEDDGMPGAEARSYRIRDRADNTRVLVVAVRREGHELTATVVSQQINDGAVRGAGPNRIGVEWSLAADRSIRTLEQDDRTGRGRDQRRVEARYEVARGVTTIRSEAVSRDGRPITRPGLSLLRLETSNGGFSIGFD